MQDACGTGPANFAKAGAGASKVTQHSHSVIVTQANGASIVTQANARVVDVVVVCARTCVCDEYREVHMKGTCQRYNAM